jgi:hypothetical protein
MNATHQGYERPSMARLGTLQELTLQFNKVGSSTDEFSNLGLVGSLIEV